MQARATARELPCRRGCRKLRTNIRFSLLTGWLRSISVCPTRHEFFPLIVFKSSACFRRPSFRCGLVYVLRLRVSRVLGGGGTENIYVRIAGRERQKQSGARLPAKAVRCTLRVDIGSRTRHLNHHIGMPMRIRTSPVAKQKCGNQHASMCNRAHRYDEYCIDTSYGQVPGTGYVVRQQRYAWYYGGP